MYSYVFLLRFKIKTEYDLSFYSVQKHVCVCVVQIHEYFTRRHGKGNTIKNDLQSQGSFSFLSIFTLFLHIGSNEQIVTECTKHIKKFIRWPYFMQHTFEGDIPTPQYFCLTSFYCLLGMYPLQNLKSILTSFQVFLVSRKIST